MKFNLSSKIVLTENITIKNYDRFIGYTFI